MKKFKATGIVYDTDGEPVGLPDEMTVRAESEDGVADAITDSTGWLVESIGSIEEVPDRKDA